MTIILHLILLEVAVRIHIQCTERKVKFTPRYSTNTELLKHVAHWACIAHLDVCPLKFTYIYMYYPNIWEKMIIRLAVILLKPNIGLTNGQSDRKAVINYKALWLLCTY